MVNDTRCFAEKVKRQIDKLFTLYCSSFSPVQYLPSGISFSCYVTKYGSVPVIHDKNKNKQVWPDVFTGSLQDSDKECFQS